MKQLEKEEERARKNFLKKKEELAKIMSVRERQENESEEVAYWNYSEKNVPEKQTWGIGATQATELIYANHA